MLPPVVRITILFVLPIEVFAFGAAVAGAAAADVEVDVAGVLVAAGDRTAVILWACMVLGIATVALVPEALLLLVSTRTYCTPPLPGSWIACNPLVGEAVCSAAVLVKELVAPAFGESLIMFLLGTRICLPPL